MAFRWTKNKLDNSLFAAIAKDNPDEKKIRDLISKGANINAVCKTGDSVIMNAISNVRFGLDLKFIKLLIDLGANLNYTEDGFNCLFIASLTWNVELVEMLLKAGADPNCVSIDPCESLLDWAEFDQWYNENEEFEGAEPMAKIVQLLKNYGAKPISEISAEKLEMFLKIYATDSIALYTAKGIFTIDKIPNVNQKLIDAFNNWVISNPEKDIEYIYDGPKITNPPDINKLKIYNKHGLVLAKNIKALIGEEIRVEYVFVKPSDFEKHKIRNIKYVVIK